MARQTPQNLRRKRVSSVANDQADDGIIRVRIRFGHEDSALLTTLAWEGEEPADTIRRLIRQSALLKPLLASMEGVDARLKAMEARGVVVGETSAEEATAEGPLPDPVAEQLDSALDNPWAVGDEDE